MEEQKKPYDIASPEVIERAKEMVLQDAKYQSLKKQYDKLTAKHQFVQAMQVRAQMDATMKAIVTKLVEKEIEERQTTEGLLKMLPYEEGLKYRDLLNALCFCFDTIDFIITDINDLLKRNNAGFNVESIPEIKACKQKVASVVSLEANKMDKQQQELYFNEADNIYAHLVWRGGVFRKKVDYAERKAKKDAKKA